MVVVVCDSSGLFVFFQAEDGIRDLVRSRGLGDVYKRQTYTIVASNAGPSAVTGATISDLLPGSLTGATWTLSLIHI